MHVAAALFGDLGMTLGVTAPAAWGGVVAAWEGFARAAGAALTTSIWQGAVLVCGLEICLRSIPRISAAQRFAVWAAGFGVIAGLPLMGLMHGGAMGADGVAGGGVAGGSAAPLLQLDARWSLLIAGVWLAASALRGTSLVMHSMRLRRLWKAAQPVEMSEALTAALKNVRGGRVLICTTQMLDRPSVIGFLAPRILVPGWLMSRLTAGELEQIVLHEAEHLRRLDDWTNLVQKLWLVAFPLNPALAWIEHRLCQQREMACDDGVVRVTNAPRAYAACLASLAERGLDRQAAGAEALSLGAWRRRSELVDRVHGILLRKRTLNKAAAGALLGAMGCALLAGTVEMAKAPQFVAFVPGQKSLATTPERQMTAERRQQRTAMLARENAEAELKLPAGFHAMQAKAALPQADRAQADRLQASTRRVRNNAAASRPAISGQGTGQVAKAVAIGDRVDSGEQQQWVVLSAWEEVRTVSRTSISDFSISDFDTSAADETFPNRPAQMPEDNRKPGAYATSGMPIYIRNYRVAQLIFRVVPVHSNSAQPARDAVRGGWFVFQL